MRFEVGACWARVQECLAFRDDPVRAYLSTLTVDMDIFTLLVQLICGAVGGNLTAKVFPSQDLGSGGNALAGLVGGAVGSSLLSSLAGIGPVPVTGPDIAQLLAQAAGGGVGGAVLALMVALLKGAVQRPSAR